MRNKTLLTLAVAGILLSACGDDGGEIGTGSPGSTSTSTRAPVATTTDTVAGPALNASSKLDLRGLGPVRVGMTLAEATAAAGDPVSAPADTDRVHLRHRPRAGPRASSSWSSTGRSPGSTCGRRAR